MSNEYGKWFYECRHQQTVDSARTVLPILLEALPEVRSAVDFGCGVGTWLSILEEEGVDEVLGVDGAWVRRDLLEIADEEFREVDLTEEFAPDRRYDLAISLEVAEHLPPVAAPRFVGSLASASDFVLFSAAIPLQGGRGHVNEQWPAYWAGLFAEQGYVALDFIRRRIWDDLRIPAWYRQNLLVYARRERLAEVDVAPTDVADPDPPRALVHPEIYLSRLDKASRRGPLRSIRRRVDGWMGKRGRDRQTRR